MSELTPTDLHFVVSRTPKDIRALMETGHLFLAGGFIRSTIAGEKVNDIDLFGRSKDELEAAAKDIALSRHGRYFGTDNAFTVLAAPRTPVQFIHRWLFNDPLQCAASFDFTIAQAVIWKDAGNCRSSCSDRFYSDLAARRLYYTSPIRNEDAGGSLLRVRKFLAAGYNIQAPSLAAVIARLVKGIHPSKFAETGEDAIADIVTGLLREVDPLRVVDGMDIIDEHQVEGA